MPSVHESFFDHVIARLFDFFSSATPWHRGLWDLGIVLTLKEILEASEAVDAGILSEGALKNLASTATALAGPDPGAGGDRQKKHLQETLRTSLRYKSVDYLVIRQMAEEIEENYLGRWSAALTRETDSFRPERTARSIASHLLDGGFSSDFLHRWLSSKVRRKGLSELASIVTAAQMLISEKARSYRVMVAFQGAPQNRSELPQNWVNATQVALWLRANAFDPSGISQNGGLWLELNARDPISAVEAAVEVIDRITARIAVGRNAQLKVLQHAWIDGQKRAFSLHRRRRGVEIHALYRENRLYPAEETSIVDAAIELLAPLANSSPSAAVAGGWAAIEALLGPHMEGEKVLAGDRMATIVACSFPRAELTPLSYTAEEGGGALAERLRQCTANRDRAACLVAAIKSGEYFNLPNYSDVAALSRIRDLLARPYAKLHDIESHVASAFRRLYRQRNLVLHGGKTDGVALRASLRTTAPLVGAGMDRLAHAWFAEKVPPLELAARARIRLELCEGTGCVDLLG